MIKESLLLIILLIFFNSITFTFAGSVTACNTTHIPNFPGSSCDNNTQPACEYGFECINSVCVRKPTTSTACVFDTECSSSGLKCIRGTCGVGRYPQSNCSTPFECLSLNCVNGLCVGKPQGSACQATVDNRCDNNLFCKTNVSSIVGSCQPNLDLNAACNSDIGVDVLPVDRLPQLSVVSACVSPNICDVRQDKCIRPGTAPLNTNVSRPSDCFWSNLAYDPVGQRCVDYCGTGINDPQCATGYTCLCPSNGQPGVCPQDPCVTQKNNILDCMRDANPPCKAIFSGLDLSSLIWRSLTNGTCIQKNCQRQVWDYECCITNFGTRGELTPGITCSEPPTPSPIPDTASALSGCVVLLVTVLFFIFIVHL